VSIMEFEADYRKAPGINASAICAGLVSMRHMHHIMTGGERDDSPAMAWGRKSHLAVLQPRLWQYNHALWTAGRKAGKEWEAFAAQVSDPDMIATPEEHAKLQAMSAAVWAHKDCAWLLEGVTTEQPIYWQDKRCGACKARVDALKPGYLLDYKTARNVDVDGFCRAAHNLHYPLRMGWYARAVETFTGRRPDVFLIVQESAAPWDCYPVHIPAALVREGEEAAIEIAIKYRCCEIAGSFAGVSDTMIEYAPPAWAMASEVSMEGVAEL
jgi:hypothetical protein